MLQALISLKIRLALQLDSTSLIFTNTFYNKRRIWIWIHTYYFNSSFI